MKLAVGFLTYREVSSKYLRDFLPSLEAALDFLSPGDYQVVAFDNSPAADRANFSLLESFNAGSLSSADGVGLIAKPRQALQYKTEGENLGFSRAYNILIGSAVAAGAEYFLVINPDTVIEPDALKKLVDALEADGNLASVAPKIRRWDFERREKTGFIDSAGLILKPGLKFYDLGQGERDRGQFDKALIIGPSGAAGLFRLSALVDVAENKKGKDDTQYFDEHFFMYKEDCDLDYRIFLAGHESRLVPEALIYHDRSAASSGTDLASVLRDRRQKSRQIRTWSFINQHLIFVKHWKKQNMASKMIISFQVMAMFIFSLILEQFLLKSYFSINKLSKGLTNIK